MMKFTVGKNLVLIAVVAMIVGAVGMIGRNMLIAPATVNTAQEQTAQVQLGQVSTMVEASGQVSAINDMDLSFGSGGTVTEIMVKPGQQVEAGQQLVRIDASELEISVAQAKSSLASAQAKLEQVKAGNATQPDIDSANSALKSAQAKYDQTMAGSLPQDIASAEATLKSAQAKLSQTLAGPTEQDIAVAQASLDTAVSKLLQLKAPPADSDVASAQAKVDQAQTSLEKTRNDASYATSQARIAMEQSTIDLQSAQKQYSTAYWNYQNASTLQRDPTTGNMTNLDPITGKPITPAQVQQYKDAMDAANLAVGKAQQNLEKAKLNYDQAQKDEASAVASAQSQLNDAQIALQKLMAPADPQAVAQAQAAVDQAQANLDKTKAGPAQADVITAQAAVDQAQANLDKLKAGPTQADAAAAQSSLDQAKASLAKLTASGTASDVAIAQASVDQAEASLELAQLHLKQATLTAPFSGVVTAINAITGQQVGGGTAVVHLTDPSSMQIVVNVSESDVGQVKAGQDVQITADALPGVTIPGKVTLVTQKGTVDQGVVNYPTTIVPTGTGVSILPGATTNVSIITAQKSNVLVVPSRAITSSRTGKIVQVKQGDLVIPVPVEIGLIGTSETEVVSGLKEGDTVVWSTAPTSTSSSGGFGGGGFGGGGALGGLTGGNRGGSTNGR